jgi:hypothetical protein
VKFMGDREEMDDILKFKYLDAGLISGGLLKAKYE